MGRGSGGGGPGEGVRGRGSGGGGPGEGVRGRGEIACGYCGKLGIELRVLRRRGRP